jgi:alpha-L-fucosidase
MNYIQAFKQAKYGLMLHFGLYSLLGGYYRGNKGPNYAEWIQCHQRISVHEMRRLASVFNPIYFDADEICTFAKRCGMQYIVITAKHHEGFALFKSEADDFNVCDATPFGRDIIGELAKSCRKYGLKLGIYYSQCIDWNEPDGGGYTVDPAGAAGVSWENSWDFPDKSKKDFSRVFERKMLPQIKEIMSNYGEIFLAWFDMPLDSTPEQSQRIYDTVKALQPNCLINSRLGNGVFDYVSLGDNEIPDEIPTEFSTDYNSIWGFKKSPYGLYESACTLNCSWGYSAVAEKWRTPEEIAGTRLKLERLGVNYLINIGPDSLGRIPYRAKEILEKAAEQYETMKDQTM